MIATKIDPQALYPESFVVELLSICRQTASKWRRAGKLVGVALSRKCVRYRGADLLAFLAAREKESLEGRSATTVDLPEWKCPCGRTCRGNGGISSHRKRCPKGGHYHPEAAQ